MFRKNRRREERGTFSLLIEARKTAVEVEVSMGKRTRYPGKPPGDKKRGRYMGVRA